VTANCN